MKKHIVLAMPSHSNFCSPMIENLKFHGYSVTFIDASPEHLKKMRLSFIDKCIHFIRKALFKNSEYKELKKTWLKEDYIRKMIVQIPFLTDHDHILVIRPDLFSQDRLQQLRQKSEHNYVGYQWNGLDRFPDTVARIGLFDRFFVFDHSDLNNPKFDTLNLIGITNFSFDMHQPTSTHHKGQRAYFVGLHFDQRVETLTQCADILSKLGIQLDFNIRILKNIETSQKKYDDSQIKIIKQNIDFSKNLEHIYRASILVDILNPIHQGLSFRTFEALYYQKKLITSNANIKNYDFYHPDNIFIWEPNNLPQLKDFLARPYSQIDQNIVEKYCFHNWLKNILDIAPYQKIVLPD